jgi:hypothetical protein
MKVGFDDGCHVAWSVRSVGEQHFLHAIGEGEQGNRVTEELAKIRFDKCRFFTPWLPILFAERALIQGQRVRNCVTAAFGAFCRGWFWFP